MFCEVVLGVKGSRTPERNEVEKAWKLVIAGNANSHRR